MRGLLALSRLAWTKEMKTLLTIRQLFVQVAMNGVTLSVREGLRRLSNQRHIC